MKICFIVFDDMTTLDFVGVYDPVTRLKTMKLMDSIEYSVCSNKEIIRTFEGLTMMPDEIKPNLSSKDVVILPGGRGVFTLIENRDFIDWIKTISVTSLIVSVCTGALIVGKAQFLEHKKATTHRNFQVELQKYCAQVIDDRIVLDGNIITARGVLSGIDVGLFLVEYLSNRRSREIIQKQMDYESQYYSDS